jgi:hypothetical protein
MARKGKENEGGKGSSSRLAYGSICLMINWLLVLNSLSHKEWRGVGLCTFLFSLLFSFCTSYKSTHYHPSVANLTGHKLPEIKGQCFVHMFAFSCLIILINLCPCLWLQSVDKQRFCFSLLNILYRIHPQKHQRVGSWTGSQKWGEIQIDLVIYEARFIQVPPSFCISYINITNNVSQKTPLLTIEYNGCWNFFERMCRIVDFP